MFHLHIKKAARRNAAFTLIELIVVVIVLGILMSVVLPNFFGASNSAKISATKQYVVIAYTAAKVSQAQNQGTWFSTQGETDASATADLVSAIQASEPELSQIVPGSAAITTASTQNRIEVDLTTVDGVTTLTIKALAQDGKNIVAVTDSGTGFGDGPVVTAAPQPGA